MDVSGKISTLFTQGVRLFRKPNVDINNYSPNDHGELVDYTFDDTDYELIEKYWVNAPYSFVVIKFDPQEREIIYEVVEPNLTTFQTDLLKTLVDDIHESVVYRADTDLTAKEKLKEKTAMLIEEYDIDISVNAFHRIFYYIERNFSGYGKMDVIMNDPNIEDISCVGYDIPLFVYHEEYNSIRTNVSFGGDELDDYIVKIVQQSGRHISIGDPMIETTLPDGSRAELSLGEEVTPRGSSFTIRKYSEDPFTPIDLIKSGTFDVKQMAYLWLAIEHQKSIVFAGGTASGKTTSMNAVSMFIPPVSKVITIEDTRELTLYHDNWLASLTREGMTDDMEVGMYDLLRSALRHRPEYIIVGEVRGEEAITLFQAMNTGHTTFSTMHADSVKTAINRLENDPINVPRSMVSSLDILCVQRLTKFEGERVRRNASISEITGVNEMSGSLDYSNVYEWDVKTDTFTNKKGKLLDEIKEETGWDTYQLQNELTRRKKILKFLLESGLNNYREFTRIINQYYVAPENIITMIKQDDQTSVTVPDNIINIENDTALEGIDEDMLTSGTVNTDAISYSNLNNRNDIDNKNDMNTGVIDEENDNTFEFSDHITNNANVTEENK